MVVPSTADGFRAMVSALRDLKEVECVSFHTRLPGDRCVRLLVKNLGRGMPESVVREELESLNIHVKGVMQLRSGRRDQDPANDCPPPYTSLPRWREDLSCQKYDHSPNSADCECRRTRMWPQKAHCNASAVSALDKRSVIADTRPGESRVAAPTSTVGVHPARTATLLQLQGKPHGELQGCVKWKEAKAALAKQAPGRARKSPATGQPAAPKAQWAGPSAEQMALGE
jgi:hypothetical protein